MFISSCVRSSSSFFPARASKEEIEWFPKNENLVRKKENSTSGPHFVFLEGAAGSNKLPVLQRLSKIGYTTNYTSFLSLFKESNCDLNKANHLFVNRLEKFSEQMLNDFKVSFSPFIYPVYVR